MKEELYDSGAISGAIIDAESPEAKAHAKMYYEYIRKIRNDIEKIADNTDFTKDQILLVKQYVFYSEHELDSGFERFAPDFYMAQSWRRLAFEPQNIQPHDIMLIRHELYEMALVTQGVPYREAHEMSNNKGLNYQKMCEEYYEELGAKQSKSNKESGALFYSEDEPNNMNQIESPKNNYQEYDDDWER
jgi:hypothetical protein